MSGRRNMSERGRGVTSDRVILTVAAAGVFVLVGCGGSGRESWSEAEVNAAVSSCIVSSGGQLERCECVIDEAQDRGYTTREFLAISAATSGERRTIADELIAACE